MDTVDIQKALLLQRNTARELKSPGWYAHLWNTEKNVTENWLHRVAHLLRAEDLDASARALSKAFALPKHLPR